MQKYRKTSIPIRIIHRVKNGYLMEFVRFLFQQIKVEKNPLKCFEIFTVFGYVHIFYQDRNWAKLKQQSNAFFVAINLIFFSNRFSCY